MAYIPRICAQIFSVPFLIASDRMIPFAIQQPILLVCVHKSLHKNSQTVKIVWYMYMYTNDNLFLISGSRPLYFFNKFSIHWHKHSDEYHL